MRCDKIAGSIPTQLCAGLLAAILVVSPALADDSLPAQTASAPATDAKPDTSQTNAKQTGATQTGAKKTVHIDWNGPGSVKKMAAWVLASGDHSALPFVIIDKSEAKVFVFDKSGGLLGTAWALVGLARGDDSIPGIGTMPLNQITPDMRTTPAGRFVAAIGYNLGMVEVLWVDYPSALSLHPVINTNPAERRLQRIVSEKPDEHRISFGCINVPVPFFNTVVNPAFKDTHGIV